MNEEFRKLRKQVHFLLADNKIPEIKSEIDKHSVARSLISTDNYICTLSIIKKSKNKDDEIKLFEELNKLTGVMKQ